jgi:hypothetical protein
MAVATRLITQQINGKVQEYIQQTLRTQARQASNRLTERSKKIPAHQRFAGILDAILLAISMGNMRTLQLNEADYH